MTVIIEICKKELFIRFGSKSSTVQLIFTLAIPLVIFLPQTTQIFLSSSNEFSELKMVFFLMIPIMSTSLIGISTFINEIRWNTIKTLLVSPIDTDEVFIGKSLACIVSGIVTDVLISLFLVLNGITLNFSTLMLFFVIGPLFVILSTFILIVVAIKFPNLAENGGSLYISMAGLMFVFVLLFLIKILIDSPQFMIDIVDSILIGLLAIITFFYAKKIFNKEKLVLSW